MEAKNEKGKGQNDKWANILPKRVEQQEKTIKFKVEKSSECRKWKLKKSQNV